MNIVATQSLDVLAGLLDDPSPANVKVVIQCFSTVYPMLFRVWFVKYVLSYHVMIILTFCGLSSCSNRALHQPWDTLSKAKTQILDLVTSSHASAGVKLSALKFMQRVILVQTRGVSDPRVRLYGLLYYNKS